MANSSIPTLQDELSITRLLNQMAYAQDTLDWHLFESSWTSTHPLEIDLSSHLSEYSADLKISTADLAHTAHSQLSGFDGTQHLLSNFVIDVDESGNRASARAYITAYHEYQRPSEEGPSSVLVRGTWMVSCVREEGGEWKAIGIKVARLVGVEGDEKLYDLAKRKGESGLGRKPLTLWTT